MEMNAVNVVMYKIFHETPSFVDKKMDEKSKFGELSQRRKPPPRPLRFRRLCIYKEVLYEVRCLKSTEDMILALAGQFKQLSHEPEKFR